MQHTYPKILNKPPTANPISVAQGLIPSSPKTTQTSKVPTVTLAARPLKTHRVGTSLSGVSTSWSSSDGAFPTFGMENTTLVMTDWTTGRRETKESAHMIARETQRIHPLAPVDMSPTGPGAHPACLESGDKTPQPTNIPYNINQIPQVDSNSQ